MIGPLAHKARSFLADWALFGTRLLHAAAGTPVADLAPAAAFHRGEREERDKVVRWLRDRARQSRKGGLVNSVEDIIARDVLQEAANLIAGGMHYR
jgi:predicted DNA-binding protein (UPF0278 family)